MVLENTTAKNVMIAEYMKVEFNPTYGYLIKPHIYTKAHQLDYHKSYDSLIPVFKKACIDMVDYTSDIVEYEKALYSCDVSILYNSVVYAIELINQFRR